MGNLPVERLRHPEHGEVEEKEEEAEISIGAVEKSRQEEPKFIETL